ncbi:MAG: ketopantoate reductase family protein [Thermoplasmatota archaeon]
MKLLVAGAGAIGQWLGARLQDAGHQAHLLARPRFADALRNGLTIDGATTFHAPVPVATDLEEARKNGPYDLVLLTCKAYDTGRLGAAVAPLLHDDGVLATLQNGLGNAQKLGKHVPPGRLAVALTSHGITVQAPGHLHHAGTGPTLVGAPDPDAPEAAHRLHDLLKDAELEPTWTDDLRSAIWYKALVNAAINPVGALHDKTNGQIHADADLQALVRHLAQEGASLAKRARVDLPGDPAEAALTTLQKTAGNRCSMLQDVQAQRPTEIEQITGRMVRLAEQLLVSLPRNEAIYGRIKRLEASYLGEEASRQTGWDEIQYTFAV